MHHRRMQLPPPAFCCSQRRERAGEPGRPLLEGFSHQSNPTNHDQLGKAFARAARVARPVFGKRLEVAARTLQGSWLRRLLSDRGSEATGGVGAVIMGKKKGTKPLGRGRPTPGISGCWQPRAYNQPSLSERLCSVSLVRQTPAVRDASQPGGLRAVSQSILHSDLVSCCVASSLYLSPFVSRRGNSGIVALTCCAGVLRDGSKLTQHSAR